MAKCRIPAAPSSTSTTSPTPLLPAPSIPLLGRPSPRYHWSPRPRRLGCHWQEPAVHHIQIHEQLRNEVHRASEIVSSSSWVLSMLDKGCPAVPLISSWNLGLHTLGDFAPREAVALVLPLPPLYHRLPLPPSLPASSSTIVTTTSSEGPPQPPPRPCHCHCLTPWCFSGVVWRIERDSLCADLRPPLASWHCSCDPW
jgi:hypothetical protein